MEPVELVLRTLQLYSALAAFTVIYCDASAFFFSSDRIALIYPAVPCWKMKSFLAPVWYITIQAKAVQVF